MLSIFEKQTTDGVIHKGLLVEFGKKSYEIYMDKKLNPNIFFKTVQFNVISATKIYVLTNHKSMKEIDWEQNGKKRKYFFDKKNKLIALNKICIMYATK